MSPLPPTTPLPMVGVLAVFYRGDDPMELNALGYALRHARDRMVPVPQLVLCVRIGEACSEGYSEYEAVIRGEFEAAAGLCVRWCSAEHCGQAVMRVSAELGVTERSVNHWVTFLHKPMKLHPKFFGYAAIALVEASRARDTKELRLVKFCIPGKDSVLENDNSIFDPNLFECLISGTVLASLQGTHAGAFLAKHASPGWNCSLMYLALGPKMFADNPAVDVENAEFMLELAWSFEPLDLVFGEPVECALWCPFAPKDVELDLALDFFRYDSDFKQLGPALFTRPSVRAGAEPVFFRKNTIKPHAAKVSAALAMSGARDCYMYTPDDFREIYVKTASRVSTVLFVFLLGWLSDTKMWRMLTNKLASSPSMRPYINRWILKSMDEAARISSAAVAVLSRLLGLNDPESSIYIGLALQDYHGGTPSTLGALLSIQKLELENLVNSGQGQFIGGMQSFSILYFLYLSRKREAERRRRKQTETQESVV